MFVDVEQGTDAWFDLRLFWATGSNFGKVMAWYDSKKLKWGDQAIKYARQKATERVTGERSSEGSFKSKYMDMGTLLEPVAKRIYEAETLYSVSNGGIFISSDRTDLPTVCDSPDGLVGKNGSVEIKCVITNTQWERIERGGYDTKYKWQLQAHMLLAERKWVDFVQYCPDMPKNKQFYLHRVYPDAAMVESLKARLFLFENFIQEKVRLIK